MLYHNTRPSAKLLETKEEFRQRTITSRMKAGYKQNERIDKTEGCFIRKTPIHVFISIL